MSRKPLRIFLRPQAFSRPEFSNIQAQLSSVIKDVIKDLDDAAVKGLEEIGAFLEEKAVAKTPVKTGKLKGSSFHRTSRDSFGPKIEVGFKDPKAIFVHEQLGAHHPVGEAKFLENAIKENLDEVKKRLIQALEDATK